MTLYTHQLVFIRHHILDVHMILGEVPTGKVLLPRSHLAYVTRLLLLVITFIKLIPAQAVNFFPVSLIDLW